MSFSRCIYRRCLSICLLETREQEHLHEKQNRMPHVLPQQQRKTQHVLLLVTEETPLTRCFWHCASEQKLFLRWQPAIVGEEQPAACRAAGGSLKQHCNIHSCCSPVLVQFFVIKHQIIWKFPKQDKTTRRNNNNKKT